MGGAGPHRHESFQNGPVSSLADGISKAMKAVEADPGGGWFAATC